MHSLVNKLQPCLLAVLTLHCLGWIDGGNFVYAQVPVTPYWFAGAFVEQLGPSAAPVFVNPITGALTCPGNGSVASHLVLSAAGVFLWTDWWTGSLGVITECLPPFSYCGNANFGGFSLNCDATQPSLLTVCPAPYLQSIAVPLVGAKTEPSGVDVNCTFYACSDSSVVNGQIGGFFVTSYLPSAEILNRPNYMDPSKPGLLGCRAGYSPVLLTTANSQQKSSVCGNDYCSVAIFYCLNSCLLPHGPEGPQGRPGHEGRRGRAGPRGRSHSEEAGENRERFRKLEQLLQREMLRIRALELRFARGAR